MTPEQKSEGPLYDAMIEHAIQREDVVNNVAAEAGKRFSPQQIRQLIPQIKSAEQGQRLMMRMALTVVCGKLREQKRMVKTELLQQAEAIQKQDPRTIPALTSVDIAKRRAAKVLEQQGATQQLGERPPPEVAR